MGDFFNKTAKSFVFAAEGIHFAFKTQINFKIQLTAALLAIILGLAFNLNRFEWIVLTLTICIVIFAELINTVVEELVNLSTADFHPKAKIAKDLSAGAVLVVSISAAIIGLLLFAPHIFP